MKTTVAKLMIGKHCFPKILCEDSKSFLKVLIVYIDLILLPLIKYQKMLIGLILVVNMHILKLLKCHYILKSTVKCIKL